LPAEVGGAGDADRYQTFTERVLPLLLAEVAAARPDLVLHTGDLAEHGNREPAGARELSAGMRALRSLDAPLLLCRGNHDGNRAWPDLCGPEAPLQWEQDGVHLFLLDDPTFAAPDQFVRLEQALESATQAIAEHGGRLFLAAHEPAYAVARPFFTDRVYAKRLADLAARFPIEALFCGHTHNQAWSLHPMPGGRRWLQVKGAAIGFPGLPTQRLDAVRAICGGPAGCELLGGYLEDGAPGWNELIVDAEWATLRWHALGVGVQMELRWRRPGEVDVVRRPPRTALPTGPLPTDATRTAARLHLAGYGGGAGRQLSLNGKVVGTIPALGSFAPRLSVPLPPELVQARNVISIETRPGDRLLVGALALEVELADGRLLRTLVDQQFQATSDDWDAWEEPRLCRLAAGHPLSVTLSFSATSSADDAKLD
jgi:predicted phosphodiesterase